MKNKTIVFIVFILVVAIFILGFLYSDYPKTNYKENNNKIMTKQINKQASPANANDILQKQYNIKSLNPDLQELKVVKIRNGTGKKIKKGDVVLVTYIGILPDGKIFDTNAQSNPTPFIIGESQVIKGWDEALVSLKEGDEIILDIPADKAYGENGVTLPDGRQIIPPNTPLRFNILIVKVLDKNQIEKKE